MTAAWGGRGTQRLVRLVLAEYGWTCWLCGQPIRQSARPRDPYGPSADHVVPRSKGGTNDLTNLRPAHLICNTRRQARTPGIVRRASGSGFNSINNPDSFETRSQVTSGALEHLSLKHAKTPRDSNKRATKEQETS